MSRITRSRVTSVISASSAKTVTGNSGGQSVGTGTTIAVLADVTAVSGTAPTMTLSVEWSDDGATWFQADPADTFTALTAVGKKTKFFDIKGTSWRAVWTIQGTTPSFTFSLRSVTEG